MKYSYLVDKEYIEMESKYKDEKFPHESLMIKDYNTKPMVKLLI